MEATPRRTSRPERPAMMKAKVETAPMNPSSMREKKSSGSVRASAMRKKPLPCRSCVHTNERLGCRSPNRRAENGAVTTVTSELTPRIQPVQRGHLLDVEGQAHEDERPGEAAEEHRERKDPVARESWQGHG